MSLTLKEAVDNRWFLSNPRSPWRRQVAELCISSGKMEFIEHLSILPDRREQARSTLSASHAVCLISNHKPSPVQVDSLKTRRKKRTKATVVHSSKYNRLAVLSHHTQPCSSLNTVSREPKLPPTIHTSLPLSSNALPLK